MARRLGSIDRGILLVIIRKYVLLHEVPFSDAGEEEEVEAEDDRKFGNELDHPFDIEACYDAILEDFLLERPNRGGVCTLSNVLHLFLHGDMAVSYVKQPTLVGGKKEAVLSMRRQKADAIAQKANEEAELRHDLRVTVQDMQEIQDTYGDLPALSVVEAASFPRVTRCLLAIVALREEVFRLLRCTGDEELMALWRTMHDMEKVLRDKCPYLGRGEGIPDYVAPPQSSLNDIPSYAMSATSDANGVKSAFEAHSEASLKRKSDFHGPLKHPSRSLETWIQRAKETIHHCVADILPQVIKDDVPMAFINHIDDLVLELCQEMCAFRTRDVEDDDAEEKNA